MATRAASTSIEHVEEIRRWLVDHGDALFAFAVQHVGSAAAAEDLVQDTFLAALQGIDRFEGRSSPRTWLTAILKHKVKDHFRRAGRAAPATEDQLRQFVEERFSRRGVWRAKPGAEPRPPSSEAERAELAAALRECLDRLPPRVRDAFLMVERDDCSADKVSQAMGLTATNVWTMLYRARIALRHCLESALSGAPRSASRG